MTCRQAAEWKCSALCKVANIHKINHLEDEKAYPDRALEEIDHVLVMRGATDRQLEYPLVYIDDKNKVSMLSLEESNENLDSFYEVIIGMLR